MLRFTIVSYFAVKKEKKMSAKLFVLCLCSVFLTVSVSTFMNDLTISV